MSASSKYNFSSGSPDRQIYMPGHRQSCGAASLDKSSSFRENMGNPLPPSLPNMTRSSSSVTQGEMLNFFQCVRFDPKSLAVEHKLNRPGEFKRLASATVGIPSDDCLPASSKSKQLSVSTPEDLRRLRSGVRESGSKARERVKILNDCLSVINKCFPTITSRKRSRVEALSNDRSHALLPIDRSAAGLRIGKVGSQNNASTSGSELEQQQFKERTKNVFPNRRPRTSTADPKGEESIALNGWEKSKMKKKRTGKKLDIAASSMMTKPLECYRESKQAMQPWLPTEARSRLNDSNDFRSGIANQGVIIGKVESNSHSSGMRSSISRADSENSRGDHPGGQEKERVNLKATNKATFGVDISSGTMTSGSKLSANVRALRSGSVGGFSKLSQVVQRSALSNDWELSNCTSKIPGVRGAKNRKSTPSARSSSPQVANWVQRPQKISRTARRTNILPTVPGNDEDPALNVTSNIMVNERNLPAHSPRQVKVKSDNLYPPALSENEESGAAEFKLKNKSEKCDEMDEKSVQDLHKTTNLLLSPRKNKVIGGGVCGDGVRRQGRTGRGFTSSRSLSPLTAEKLGNVRTKQIRSSRLGLDKHERAGRPPTRKLSDKKAYTRQKSIANNTRTDIFVGSDVGHEELLAAANAVSDTAQALFSPFWKKMETLFRFISDRDISYLKHQVNFGLTVDTPPPALATLDNDSFTLKPNGCQLNEFGREESETRTTELGSDHLSPEVKLPNETSLWQRLLSALIPEEGDLEIFCTGKEDNYDVYESRSEIEKDVKTGTSSTCMSESCDLSGYTSADGNVLLGLDNLRRDTNTFLNSRSGVVLSHDHLQNGLLEEQLILGTTYSKYQYHNLSINEKLLLEINSIGIYPDLGSGDDEVRGDISRLIEKYQGEVSRNRSWLDKLLTSASEAKELQEKEFEGRALEKIMEMAYEKYLTMKIVTEQKSDVIDREKDKGAGEKFFGARESFWGFNTHGMKSVGGKMAKQAALVYVKHVVERWEEFEVTGKSCFDEPLYKDAFLSGVSRFIDGQPLSSNTVSESSKFRRSTSGCSAEVRTSARGGTQQSPSDSQEMYSSEAFLPEYLGSEENTGIEDSWSNRANRRELLLDGVGRMINTSPGVQSGLVGSLACSAKGKRSERNREGNGYTRGVLIRRGTTKIGRPASATSKGERKSKAKAKQNTHLSATINVPSGPMPLQPKLMLSSAHKSNDIIRNDFDKDKNDYDLDMLEEPIKLSGLQLPEMDNFDPDDLGGQGEDIGSWLNIEDDGLQDHDFMGGLEIPMDDLNMVV